jgi:cytochrome b6-f complex subunit 8
VAPDGLTWGELLVTGTPLFTSILVRRRRSFGTVTSSFRPTAVLITLGWAALAATFTFSIAMVVWGRNGDGSINF